MVDAKHLQVSILTREPRDLALLRHGATVAGDGDGGQIARLSSSRSPRPPPMPSANEIIAYHIIAKAGECP